MIEETSDYVGQTCTIGPIKSGESWTATELTLADYDDGEQLLGKPESEWFSETEPGVVSMDRKTLTVLLWLMCRSKDDKDQWQPAYDDFRRAWTMEDFNTWKKVALDRFFHQAFAGLESTSGNSSPEGVDSPEATSVQ